MVAQAARQQHHQHFKFSLLAAQGNEGSIPPDLTICCPHEIKYSDIKMLAATEIGHIESFRPKRFAQRYRVDPLLTLVVIVTALYGLFVLYSASGQNISMVVRQAAHVVVGLGIMIVVSQAGET